MTRRRRRSNRESDTTVGNPTFIYFFSSASSVFGRRFTDRFNFTTLTQHNTTLFSISLCFVKGDPKYIAQPVVSLLLKMWVFHKRIQPDAWTAMVEWFLQWTGLTGKKNYHPVPFLMDAFSVNEFSRSNYFSSLRLHLYPHCVFCFDFVLNQFGIRCTWKRAHAKYDKTVSTVAVSSNLLRAIVHVKRKNCVF